MCIIAAIRPKAEISKTTLKTCWNNNSQGGGFMYTDGKSVIIEKELNSFKRYFKKFTEARTKFPDSAFICHFRISTHGNVDLTNCHPFPVNKHIGFCHNGIINSVPYSDDYSDTYMFNEYILKHLPSDFLYEDVYRRLIEGFIGGGNKLAFLTTYNEIIIYNEESGVWDNNVWYSNTGYKASKYTDYGGTCITANDMSSFYEQYMG